MQDTHNIPEYGHTMRFCHFIIECKTHEQGCDIRYPELVLCQENNGDNILYYRPRSAMRFGLVAERFFKAFPSHNLLISPLKGRTKRKDLRFIEDRGLFQTEENNRRGRLASRSRSRSRSRSYSAERCNTLIKKGMGNNVIAYEADPRSDHLANRVKMLEELTHKLLRERELTHKEIKEGNEKVQEGLRIQKEQIALCRQEIQTHDEQINYCLDKTTQISDDLRSLREDLESHKANALKNQEKWEKLKSQLMSLN